MCGLNLKERKKNSELRESSGLARVSLVADYSGLDM